MDADIIIVGAGTAGCVLAETLTRSGALRVALVEAGGAPSSPFVGIPAGFAKLFRSKLDWAFWSEPLANAGGRSVFIPRGKMLGGCATMNAQIHQWGHPLDFDAWRNDGCDDWGWSDVSPIFAAQERVLAPSPGRGDAGPLRVEVNANVNPATHAFVTAARALTPTTAGSYNNTPTLDGAWVSEISHHGGRRYSAFDAYLKPAMGRSNLSVVTGLTVDRVLFEGRRATGIVGAGPGGRREIRARAGVMLAAGAIGSPVVLMRSGIGSASQLRTNAIDVLVDLPGVGANLHDHPMSVLIGTTRRRDTFKSAESAGNLAKYVLKRAGPLASNAAEAIAFGRSSPSAPAPDMELIFAPLEWREEALKPPKVHALTIGAAVLTPHSRGAVRLRDTAVSIDLGLFSDPDGHDQRVLLSALRWARNVAAQAPLQSELTGELDPAPWDGGDDALFAWACRTLQTVYHPAGTCSMGRGPQAVATPRLAVNGVDALWVADASIMPSPLRGHPNAAVAMIAERAAQFVQRALR